MTAIENATPPPAVALPFTLAARLMRSTSASNDTASHTSSASIGSSEFLKGITYDERGPRRAMFG
jgi:hypothetical protein